MRRVLPPGGAIDAEETNVDGFVDALLTRPRFVTLAPRLTRGLALLDALARAHGRITFAAAPSATQDAILAVVHGLPRSVPRQFFRTLVHLTLESALAAPAHGGNRDSAGWRAMGYVPHPRTHGADPAP